LPSAQAERGGSLSKNRGNCGGSYEDGAPFTLVELVEAENESDLLMLPLADVQFHIRPVS